MSLCTKSQVNACSEASKLLAKRSRGPGERYNRLASSVE